MPPPYTVAVIGAGPQGLAALKNILEESAEGEVFQPTLFEARDHIGGLWAYSNDGEIATVLKSTLGNVSRYRNCYGDFPVEEEDGDWDATGAYQGREGFLRYLERYVKVFGLSKSIELGLRVTGLRRVEESGKWELLFSEESTRQKHETRLFDKVIVATGQYIIPFLPGFEGVNSFGDRAFHSKNYKNASTYDGKKVLICGFGNTAADIATELVGHAEKIFLSHRHGSYILPRINQGKPLDLFSNHRKNSIKNAVSAIAPVWAQRMTDSFVEKMSDAAFRLQPEWRFRPTLPLVVSFPIISDTLVDCLATGSIVSTAALSRVVDARTVELDDGSRIEADYIIFCTGYRADLSLMPGVEADVSERVTDASHGATDDELVPRLYQNIFAPAYADSLAFLSNWRLGSGICDLADLISMAIAQIWKGSYLLPSKEQMNREIDKHQEWCHAVTEGKAATPKLVDEGKWRAWLNEAAGTGFNDNLGYGLNGWWCWMRDPTFCNLLMSGIDSPHILRLFDGRRKKWDGARRAILQANEDVDRKFGSKTVVK